jgi:hypothetical protein
MFYLKIPGSKTYSDWFEVDKESGQVTMSQNFFVFIVDTTRRNEFLSRINQIYY